MTAAPKLRLLSEQEYLAAELASPVKHEFLGGTIYAMAGARVAHNIIAGNVFGTLHAQLRGKPCRPFNSDMKVRVRVRNRTYFYYPDVSVICRPAPRDQAYQDEPVVLVEVLSEDTRRIDEGEKRAAYLTIPSLASYLLVEQSSAAVVVERRVGQEFVREVYEGLGAVIPLPEIQAALPLSEIYEGVELGEVSQ